MYKIEMVGEEVVTHSSKNKDLQEGEGKMDTLKPKGNFESPPHPWIIRDNNDKPWGPFDSAAAAQAWAQKKWPNIPEYDEENHDGHGCWTVEAVWSPNAP